METDCISRVFGKNKDLQRLCFFSEIRVGNRLSWLNLFRVDKVQEFVWAPSLSSLLWVLFYACAELCRKTKRLASENGSPSSHMLAVDHASGILILVTPSSRHQDYKTTLDRDLSLFIVRISSWSIQYQGLMMQLLQCKAAEESIEILHWYPDKYSHNRHHHIELMIWDPRDMGGSCRLG